MRTLISPKDSIIKLAEMYPFELTEDNLSCVFNNSAEPVQYDADRKYKLSAFNYICVGNKCVSIYNTLYSSLALLSFEEYKNIEAISKCSNEFISEMIQDGFWVKKRTDEKAFFLDCSAFLNDICDGITLTLAVTHNCNARCSYCYEQGIIPSSMNEDIINDVVNFISTLGNGIRINWFVVEPLLNTKAIDEISNRLHEKNIDFTSYLITNGSLIDDGMVKKMIEVWNVKDVQISIDGQEETYLRVKNYKKSDDMLYYKILGNIIKLAKAGIFVHIRINISHDNIKEVLGLQKELENVFSQYNNIIIYPAFVSGTGDPFSEDEMIELVSEMMMNTRDVSKLTADSKLFSLPRLHSCAVHSKNSFTVDSDGFIYKCEHHVGDKEESIGNVCRFDLINRNVLNSIPDHCKDCVFLPKCMGGCKENEASGDIPCFIEKYIIIGYINCITS